MSTPQFTRMRAACSDISNVCMRLSVPRKSYVEFDDGEKGPVPNSWIHKMVRFGGGTARFGGSHLIHWDSTLGQSLFGFSF